jgi:hypothetical protein
MPEALRRRRQHHHPTIASREKRGPVVNITGARIVGLAAVPERLRLPGSKEERTTIIREAEHVSS